MKLVGYLVYGVVAAVASVSFGANEIGFVEDFSLARDRTEALKQLIPGTEDYYFYHCLHYQHTGDQKNYTEMLDTWIRRHKYTSGVKEMINRQALLDYEKSPRKSLAHFIEELDLHYEYTREISDRKTDYPTRLNPDQISIPALLETAFRHDTQLGGIEDAGLDILPHGKLDPKRRRHLLSRLQRPDIPDLSALVVADLNHKRSGGFGSHSIHHHLTLSQLNACREQMPRLLENSVFVYAVLARLEPNDDTDVRFDPGEESAYINRLVEFTRTLAPTYNSLKAHALYHRLRLDRATGTYDHGRFLEYISFPRHASYLNPEYLRLAKKRNIPIANLDDAFENITFLPRIDDDEPLVRDYLTHFFVEADDYLPYEQLIRENYLKKIFSETKILNGIGDPERWTSLIRPKDYQMLKERTDLDFSPANPVFFAANEPVSLDLFIKNIDTLIVKVFRINAFNYYRLTSQEITTGIELDGLVAEHEQVITYEEAPVHRVKRTFGFPQCREPGVYVVEWIGNGVSSRAVVHKGHLHVNQAAGPAGHEFTVYDEANQRRPEATLWLEGREYTPDQEGVIFVPFSTHPKDIPIVLKDGDRCSLTRFSHRAESYSLTAGFYVDRESLLRGTRAQAIIRPRLLLNNQPVSLSLLEEIRFTMESIDHDGISSRTETGEVLLREDQEFVYTFRVPDGLARLAFTLRARVQNESQGKHVDLHASKEFSLNEIDREIFVEDLFLKRDNGEYRVQVLGKNGEPKPARPIHVELKHRYFTQTVRATLQTDDNGAVLLSACPGIEWIKASGPEKTSRTWQLSRDRYVYPTAIHSSTEEPLRVPFVGNMDGEARLQYTFMERRGGVYIHDKTPVLKRESGFLVGQGLPPGDYELFLKGEGVSLPVRLTRGKTELDFILSKHRVLQRHSLEPLHIAALSSDGNLLTARIANASPFTRVHIVATRFHPAYSLFNQLRFAPHTPARRGLAKSQTQYVSGRNIGDEYRYILERRHTNIFPGNMLLRPTLLLHPWSIRKTKTGVAVAAEGEEFDALGMEPPVLMDSASDSIHFDIADEAGATDPSTLDFLSSPSIVLANLQPDKKGIVSVNHHQLGGHSHIHVLAVDPLATAYRELSLSDTPTEPRDLRLATGLDPKIHYAEQKTISSHSPDDPFQLEDVNTSKIEVFDSLTRAFNFFQTISGNRTLDEFNFILRWPSMDEEEKRGLYTKYACHELNIFLYHKDPSYFRNGIKPSLTNKKHKTFLDHWLLGNNLSPFLDAWGYSQLNAAEQILLAQRGLPGGEGIVKDIGDRNDLIPPDTDLYNNLFDTALKGSALEAMLEGRIASSPPPSPALQKKNGKGVHAQVDIQGGGTRSGKPHRDKLSPDTDASTVVPASEGLLGDEMSAGEFAPPATQKKEAKKPGRSKHFFARRDAARRQARPLFRQTDQTEEWAESNYYKLPIARHNAKRISVNTFWDDYATHDPAIPFVSPNFIYAGNNFSEIMLALSILDLPFVPPDHRTRVDDEALTLIPASPTLVACKAIRESNPLDEPLPILVSQNFFRADDRYRYEDNEKFDKFLTEEFLTEVAYGCQVVLTNPTSSRQKLAMLLQIPEGSLPLVTTFFTKSFPVNLTPYSTRSFDYFFYFPTTGRYCHYPVHVAKEGRHVATVEPLVFTVVDELSKVDTGSWEHISQNGNEEEVIQFLKTHNLHRHDLERIAWRFHNIRFYHQVIGLLEARRMYHHALWSFALIHNDPVRAREYLRHSSYADRCGGWIDTPLLAIDPVERKTYQHLEYSPLINARAHMLGKRRTILNNRLREQYHALLRVLRYRPHLTSNDLLTVSYFLFLQDRVGEGLAFFHRVQEDLIHERVQYDYVNVYAAFYRGDLEDAQAIVDQYGEHPDPRWRKRFAEVNSQLKELAGLTANPGNKEDPGKIQDQLAASEPSLEFSVENKRVRIGYRNLTECVVNYYPMDIELLFSRNPFVQEDIGHFAYITPRISNVVVLPGTEPRHEFDLPESFHAGNVMVEIVAGGLRKSQAYYAHALALQVVENYGRIRVEHQDSEEPLPKTYVKVYARMIDHSIRFYKDGYTDRRGLFDYASLSTGDLQNVAQFALLILHPEHGAVIKEAAPPSW